MGALGRRGGRVGGGGGQMEFAVFFFLSFSSGLLGFPRFVSSFFIVGFLDIPRFSYIRTRFSNLFFCSLDFPRVSSTFIDFLDFFIVFLSIFSRPFFFLSRLEVWTQEGVSLRSARVNTPPIAHFVVIIGQYLYSCCTVLSSLLPP